MYPETRKTPLYCSFWHNVIILNNFSELNYVKTVTKVCLILNFRTKSQFYIFFTNMWASNLTRHKDKLRQSNFGVLVSVCDNSLLTVCAVLLQNNSE